MRFLRVLLLTAAALSFVPKLAAAALRCEILLQGRDFLEQRLEKTMVDNLRLPAGHDALVHKVAEALHRGDWNAEILSPLNSNSELILKAALEAYRRSHLHLEQLTTLTLRWSALDDFSIAAPNHAPPRPLLDSSASLTPEAVRIFSGDGRLTGLSTSQLEAFARELALLPASEHWYWQIRIPATLLDGGRRRSLRKAYDAILRQDALRLFWRLDRLKNARKSAVTTEPLLTLPSFGALQVYLRALHPGNAVELIPEFGTSEIEGVLDGIRAGGRVLALSFPGTQGLLEAEGLRMGKVFAALHDFDHAANGTRHTREFRTLMAHCATLVLRYQRARDGGEPAIHLDGRPVGIAPKDALLGAESIADLYFTGTRRGVEDFAQSLVLDLGGPPERNGATALVIWDMARNPRTYESMGVDIGQTLIELGPTAQRLYEQARSQK